MAKTFNDIWTERELTRNSIKAFTDAAFANYGTHAYGAGYLESLLASVVMDLPKAKREQLRKDMQAAAIQQEYKQLVTTIKGE